MIKKVHCDNGCKLAYKVYGDKEGYPVLTHHGLVGSIIQPNLEEELVGLGIRMINIARPGYGESSVCKMESYADWARMIKPLIAELELSKFDVLGMSAGAPYCYALGALMPDKVQRIFIYSGLPALCETDVMNAYPNLPDVKKEYAFYRQASLEDIAKSLYKMYLASLSEEVLELIDFRDSMANNCFGMAREAKLQSLDWGFNLKDVRPPVLMQHSKIDQEAPFAAARKTSDLLPDCTLQILENAPHFSEETLSAFFSEMISKIKKIF